MKGSYDIGMDNWTIDIDIGAQNSAFLNNPPTPNMIRRCRTTKSNSAVISRSKLALILTSPKHLIDDVAL